MYSVVINVFRNKKKYIPFLLMFILCFLLILILSSTKDYYNYLLNDVCGSELNNRKLIIYNTEDVLNKITKLKEIEEYYPVSLVDGKINYYIVITKNYLNTKKVLNIFEKDNYVAFLEDASGVQKIEELQKFIDFLQNFIFVLIIIIFILIIVVIKNIIYNETKDLAILKATGYNNFLITNILILRIFIILFFSFLISLIIFILGFSIINIFFSKSSYLIFLSNFSFITNYLSLSIFYIILPIFNYLNVYHKVSKLSIISALND